MMMELERVKGIEPSQPAWKAGALPLSYTRILKNHHTKHRLFGISGDIVERMTRFELATLALARRCSTTEPHPHIYFIKFIMATRMGFEPTTSAVTGRHSNQLNYRAIFDNDIIIKDIYGADDRT